MKSLDYYFVIMQTAVGLFGSSGLLGLISSIVRTVLYSAGACYHNDVIDNRVATAYEELQDPRRSNKSKNILYFEKP